jgi:hypothetical protein
MKAWLVTHLGERCMVIAETAAAAKYVAARSADEAGYGMTFNGTKARRSPEHDHLAERLPCGRKVEPNFAYSLEYANAPCGCTMCAKAAAERGKAPNAQDQGAEGVR